MNKSDVAAALRTISQGFFDLSAAIDTPPAQGTAADAGRAVVAPARPDEPEWAPLEDDSQYVAEPGVPAQPRVVKPVPKLEGSLANCPKHRIPFKEGRYGKFCPAQSDEEGWSNDKGFCRITDKNVDVWLRQHSGVPA